MQTIETRIEQQEETIKMAAEDLATRTPGTQAYRDRAKALAEAKAWLAFLKGRLLIEAGAN